MLIKAVDGVAVQTALQSIFDEDSSHMTAITETLSSDHRRCDEIFALVEEWVSKKDWARGGPGFTEFHEAMEHHFAMEEGVLFPSFESRTGQTMGPTQVMRSEHIQMRQLFGEMKQAVELQDHERYLGLSETLMMIMQQHNMKEEQMLYRMADQVLAADAETIIQQMKEV